MACIRHTWRQWRVFLTFRWCQMPCIPASMSKSPRRRAWQVDFSSIVLCHHAGKAKGTVQGLQCVRYFSHNHTVLAGAVSLRKLYQHSTARHGNLSFCSSKVRLGTHVFWTWPARVAYCLLGECLFFPIPGLGLHLFLYLLIKLAQDPQNLGM